jgi:exonuclease SbcC
VFEQARDSRQALQQLQTQAGAVELLDEAERNSMQQQLASAQQQQQQLAEQQQNLAQALDWRRRLAQLEQQGNQCQSAAGRCPQAQQAAAGQRQQLADGEAASEYSRFTSSGRAISSAWSRSTSLHTQEEALQQDQRQWQQLNWDGLCHATALVTACSWKQQQGRLRWQQWQAQQQSAPQLASLGSQLPLWRNQFAQLSQLQQRVAQAGHEHTQLQAALSSQQQKIDQQQQHCVQAGACRCRACRQKQAEQPSAGRCADTAPALAAGRAGAELAAG